MKNKKIFTIIIIAILTIILFTNISYVQGATIANSVDAAQRFEDNGKTSIINYKGIYIAMRYIYNIAMTIAIIVAIIVGLILGIRIIFGGIDEKADAKHLLVPYLVILIVVSFGLALWRAGLALLSV